MKKLTFFITLCCITALSYAQQSHTDSLLMLLSKAKQDTTRVNLLSELSVNYFNSNPDSQFLLADEGLKIAQIIGYKKGEMRCKETLADYWWAIGDYATATKFYLENVEFAKSQKDTLHEVILYSTLVNSFRDQGDFKEALRYSLMELEMTQKQFSFALGIANAGVGSVYYGMNNFDSALTYLNKALGYPDNTGQIGWIWLMSGRTQAKMKNSNKAMDYYRQSIEPLRMGNNLKDLAGAYISIGELYEETGNPDSAIYYGKQALNIAQQKNFNKEIWQSYLLLAKAYEKINAASALDYYKRSMVAKDSLYNQEKQRQILSYKFNEELRQQEIKNVKQQSENRNRIYILLAILTCFLLFVIFLIGNNKQKQKVNTLLQQQKQEIESTLSDLKATQSQLVQSEKMASLGELTAGIAHEIQNPLNFVNNFSEVNTELIEELEQEGDKGNMDEVKAIAKDIKENEQKINFHGKRADAIVKGMLQHSRANTGKKEPTDINALADEYLRLSYHGLRAKDKSFNTDFTTAFDENIGKVNVVPQDIGRVLLNLYNNAFYVVNEKKKQLNETFNPVVSVTTRKENDRVVIVVRDNGSGIPQKAVDKIFQPFFTTKPTGQGTGLGLSLSYDIIKAHGGELEVETKEGEGAEFIIHLPIQ